MRQTSLFILAAFLLAPLSLAQSGSPSDADIARAQAYIKINSQVVKIEQAALKASVVYQQALAKRAEIQKQYEERLKEAEALFLKTDTYQEAAKAIETTAAATTEAQAEFDEAEKPFKKNEDGKNIVRDLKKKRGVRSERLRKSQVEMNKLRSKIRKLEKHSDFRSGDSVDTLRAKLARQKRIDQYEARIKELSPEISKLQSELRTLKKEIGSYEKKKKNAQKKLNDSRRGEKRAKMKLRRAETDWKDGFDKQDSMAELMQTKRGNSKLVKETKAQTMALLRADNPEYMKLREKLYELKPNKRPADKPSASKKKASPPAKP